MGGYLLLPSPAARARLQSPAVIIDLAPAAGRAGFGRTTSRRARRWWRRRRTPQQPTETEPQKVEPMPKLEAPRRGDAAAARGQRPAETKPSRAAGGPENRATKPRQQKRRRRAPRPRRVPSSRSRRSPAAPSPGSAASRAAIASWRDLVVARLQQSKRYPSGAEARREQGVVTLSFSVDRNGQVLSRSIARSSGHPALDQEVLAMVQRAQPLPAFPAAMPQSVGQSDGADPLLGALAVSFAFD